MVTRYFKPLKSRSFFIFGPRGVGKSTWIRATFKANDIIYLNFLDPEVFDKYLLDPKILNQVLALKENKNKIIVIDEIQRVPEILNIVHNEISLNQKIFILTGSSARKLKQKGVNLLAGRASVYYLHPFSMFELKNQFELSKALERGLLPEAYFAETYESASEYLKSYVYTYIEKEIQQEQWVKKLEPFRKFLQIAAQSNSKIINKSKISRQVGVESTTIENYFEILEETMIGFRLPGFDASVRKQVRLAEKFYFFDTGVVRAIEKTLTIPMINHTSYYGVLFENFIVSEIRKMIEYDRLDWTISYLQTKENFEIDLVILLPTKKLILIEIKSTENLTDEDFRSMLKLGPELEKKYKLQKMMISQDQTERIVQGIHCLHYKDLQKIKDIFSEF